MPRQVACRNCGNLLSADTIVRLWDGHAYCRDCVEAGCPGLADYAGSNARLEENLPHSAWKVVARPRNVVLLVFVPIAVFAVLWPLTLFVAVFALLKMLIQVDRFNAYRPVVSVARGRVNVRWGRKRVDTYDLADCAWFHGRMCQMDFFRGDIPDGPAVLLVLPESDVRSYCMAVGYTEEMRWRWAAFLTLAGLPQRRAWRPGPRGWALVLSVVRLLATLPMPFLGAYASGRLISDCLRALGCAPESVVLVRTVVGLAVLITLFVVLKDWLEIPSEVEERPVPTRRPAAERERRRWRRAGTIFLLLVMLGAHLAFAFREVSTWGLAAGSLLWLGWSAGMALYAGHREANFDWEPAAPVDASVSSSDEL